VAHAEPARTSGEPAPVRPPNVTICARSRPCRRRGPEGATGPAAASQVPEETRAPPECPRRQGPPSHLVPGQDAAGSRTGEECDRREQLVRKSDRGTAPRAPRPRPMRARQHFPVDEITTRARHRRRLVSCAAGTCAAKRETTRPGEAEAPSRHPPQVHPWFHLPVPPPEPYFQPVDLKLLKAGRPSSKTLDEGELARVAEVCREQKFTVGQYVFKEGEARQPPVSSSRKGRSPNLPYHFPGSR